MTVFSFIQVAIQCPLCARPFARPWGFTSDKGPGGLWLHGAYNPAWERKTINSSAHK